MKILIIEDEPFVARDLQNQLSRLEPQATIVDVITSIQSAKKWFASNPLPDLIFSDIQLSDGISFEIFEGLHISSPVIFTTAFDEYAIRAFKLNSIDYLLKPIDGAELAVALEKYKSLSGDAIAEQLKNLLGQWGSKNKKYKERFLTVHRNTLIPVSQQEIAYFHKEELIHLVTAGNEKLLSEHQTLDEIEGLVNPDFFFRVNRQFIVHVQAVGKIKTSHKGLTVQLKTPFNVEMDISREKATAFKNWLGQ